MSTEFEDVIERHVAAVKAEWAPELVVLFEAEAAASREVFDNHQRHMDVLAQRHRSRAETFGEGFTAALRLL